MPSDNFPSHSTEVALQIALLRAVDDGQLEGLICPKCKMPKMSVRFSNPMPSEYRTWFICQECGFKVRAQNSARPKSFSEERIDSDLELLDSSIQAKSKFNLES